MQQVTDQVVRVFKALQDPGVVMQNLAIYGDSPEAVTALKKMERFLKTHLNNA